MKKDQYNTTIVDIDFDGLDSMVCKEDIENNFYIC